MGKSLGDYNIEKSSSSDINNIQWSQKNLSDLDKPKKKKTDKKFQKSPTNIIYAKKVKVKPSVEKVFKINESENIDKSKKEKTDKKFQKSSASNSKIKRDYKRPAR